MHKSSGKVFAQPWQDREGRHLLRLAFHRPWRQTEGLLRSIATLLGVSLAIPDHTTFSRRSIGLSLSTTLTPSSEPVPVVIAPQD